MLANLLGNLAVAVIVLLAAVYAGAKYLPAAWRKRVVYLLTRGAPRQSRIVRWLDAEASCGSGCESCKACADPAPEAGPGGSSAATRVIKLHRRP